MSSRRRCTRLVVWGEAKEVADLITGLASDNAKDFTDATNLIDVGYTALYVRVNP